MKVLITGASRGIGLATAKLFAERHYQVVGMDIVETEFVDSNYQHVIADVTKESELPEIGSLDILINNAGVQDEEKAVSTNLMGVINCTNKYVFGNVFPPCAIVNVASVSGHNGSEFPLYAASKGGVLTYTKWTAQQVAKYGTTCNSISPGGVLTAINNHIINSPQLMRAVLDETLLHRWATPEEIAEWIYFIAVVNRSMTGQDVVIDNGETAKTNFIW